MKKIFLNLTVFSLMLLLFACTSNPNITTANANSSNGKDLLLTEKTTQYFLDEELPEVEIEGMLKAGINATSAMNKQNWHFSAVTNKQLLSDMKNKSEENMPAQMKGQANKKASIGDSPLAIVVSCPENEKFTEFDAGLATQNICDYATLSGYGIKIVASPCSMINENFKKELNIPSNMNAVAVILIGKNKDMSNVDSVTSASTRKAFDEVVSLIK